MKNFNGISKIGMQKRLLLNRAVCGEFTHGKKPEFPKVQRCNIVGCSGTCVNKILKYHEGTKFRRISKEDKKIYELAKKLTHARLKQFDSVVIVVFCLICLIGS